MDFSTQEDQLETSILKLIRDDFSKLRTQQNLRQKQMWPLNKSQNNKFLVNRTEQKSLTIVEVKDTQKIFNFRQQQLYSFKKVPSHVYRSQIQKQTKTFVKSQNILAKSKQLLPKQKNSQVPLINYIMSNRKNKILVLNKLIFVQNLKPQ